MEEVLSGLFLQESGEEETKVIRLATKEDEQVVIRLCSKNAWDGTTILSAYQSKCEDVHNADWQYCDLWVGESGAQKKNAQYLLCRQGQNFHIVGKPHSKQRWQELHDFLSMQAAGSHLIADQTLLEEYELQFLSSFCQQTTGTLAPRMLSTHLPEEMEDSSVQESQSLWGIYDLLAAAKPEMLKKVSKDDYTARMRFSQRGGAKFFEILNDTQTPVCIGAILLPEQGDYGLIFNICTHPQYRGRGYARKMVMRLCMEAYLQGKTPVLDCASSELEEYYSRLGFQTVSHWGKRLLTGCVVQKEEQ